MFGTGQENNRNGLKSKQWIIFILISFDELNFCSINILLQRFHGFVCVF